MDTVSLFIYMMAGASGLAIYNATKEIHKLQAQKMALLNPKLKYPFSIQNSVDLKPLQDKQPQTVYIEMPIKNGTYNQSTFIKRMQSVELIPHDHYQIEGDFFEGQCGNNFEYRLNDQQIKVDIKECNIYKLLLTKKVEKIHLKGSKMNQLVDITYKLNALLGLTLFGYLRFDIEEKQFVLEPLFIVPIRSQFYFPLVSNFFDCKIQKLSLKRILLGITLGFMIPFICYKVKDGLVSLWRRITGKPSLAQQQKKFTHIQTRPKDRLKCPCGNNMNLIGNCGHLSMCSNCFDVDQHCKICNKVINNHTIIFI